MLFFGNYANDIPHCVHSKTISSRRRRDMICFEYYIVVLFTLSVVLVASVEGFPWGRNKLTAVQGLPTLDALNFMKQYGYIEESDSKSEALFTEEGLEEVIRAIQKFGAIEQTGRLDNATMNLMSRPRCGVPDIIRGKRSKRFILGPSGWNKRNISFFIANWPTTLSEAEVSKNILVALDSWGRYGRLRFTQVYDVNADIIVAFGSGYHGDRYPFDGPGNVLAHAFFPYEMDSYGGDIHFDNDENWKTNGDDDGVDFLTVAIHELGHSLGIAHSYIPSSVMFPYYKGSEKYTALDYDDILAMYELYIKRRLEGDDLEFSTTTNPRSTNRYPYTDRTEYLTPTTPSTTTTWRTTTYYSNDSSTTYVTSYTHPTNPLTSTTASSTSTVTYEGDVETVDDHKDHDPKHGIPPTNSPSLPDICQGKFDAVVTIRNEIFIFKDQYVWRLKNEYEIVPGYPVSLQQMFPKLPMAIKRIDAAYERSDGKIVLFTGMFYWVYDGTFFIENSPLSIKRYGFPSYVDKIDAVQVWAKNGKTYFYRGNEFWRFNETSMAMDAGYPKHMERWRGVPICLDAATTWKGVTYFFKDKCYWKFDNDWVIITESSPLPIAQTLLGCPKEEVEACEPNNELYLKLALQRLGYS